MHHAECGTRRFESITALSPNRSAPYALRYRSWQGEQFLLSIAQHRRNKNIPLLVRAFHRLLRQGQIAPATKLVIVGIAGPETRRIHELVSRCGLSRSVLFLEGLSEAELQWCYARCEALVAPSRTEGFGLPVAEALLAGCRVICSDIPAFREVGAEHCRFVALGTDAEEALAEGIVVTLQEPVRKCPCLFRTSLLKFLRTST